MDGAKKNSLCAKDSVQEVQLELILLVLPLLRTCASPARAPKRTAKGAFKAAASCAAATKELHMQSIAVMPLNDPRGHSLYLLDSH